MRRVPPTRRHRLSVPSSQRAPERARNSSRRRRDEPTRDDRGAPLRRPVGQSASTNGRPSRRKSTRAAGSEQKKRGPEQMPKSSPLCGSGGALGSEQERSTRQLDTLRPPLHGVLRLRFNRLQASRGTSPCRQRAPHRSASSRRSREIRVADGRPRSRFGSRAWICPSVRTSAGPAVSHRCS